VLKSRGFTLIELMIGITIMAIIMFVALPAFTQWLQNTQIRNATEAALTGLNLARNEAIRRNSPVRFQYVNTLDASCTVSTANLVASPSLNWIVSINDPSGLCNQAPSDTVAPLIIQSRSANEGTANVRLDTTGGASVTFNGLGRVSGTGMTQLEFKNQLGACSWQSSSGTMRCLRIVVSPGGQIRMCDPKVVAPTLPDVDPRAC